jgi:hypothetical protein
MRDKQPMTNDERQTNNTGLTTPKDKQRYKKTNSNKHRARQTTNDKRRERDKTTNDSRHQKNKTTTQKRGQGSILCCFHTKTEFHNTFFFTCLLF